MATITVTSLADSGAGSLRQAVSNANSGDTIAFAANLAGQTIALTSGQLEVAVGKNLTVDGVNSPGLTISGNNASRIFHLNSTSVNPTQLTVKNITLANAYTSDIGGAILTEHQGQLVIENVNFNNNTADRGGGAIYSSFEGTLSVTGSTFDGNVAIAGNDERGAGAIAFFGDNEITIRDSDFTNNRGINGAAINSLQGELTIENSRFINNDTTAAFYDAGNQNPFLRGFGGAIYTDRASSGDPGDLGSIRIIDSVFEGNRGRGEGGAAYLFTGTEDEVIVEGSTFRNNEVIALPNGGNGGIGGAIVQMNNGVNRGFTIANSSFVNNTAAVTGGGVWTTDTPVTITNSTFSGNRAESLNFDGNGGALFMLENAATITNSTFANNYAGWVGGAITASDESTVTNTIFYQNTAANGNNGWGIYQHTSGELVDGGNNIQFTGGDKATTNVTIVDPLLGALQNINGAWVHPLLPGSPAIDAGNGSAPATDQRGVARQDGDLNGSVLPDIGAYEAGGNPPPAAPEIEILDGATNILDGTTAALDFGTTAVGTPISKTFTIRNTGTSALDLSNLSLPNGFSIVGNLPATVAAGGEASLQIQLDGTTAGAANGELSVVTNDSDENPFNFAISGNVTAAPPPAAPEIEILDGTTNILDGTIAAIDFGSADVGGTLTKTFTIRNTGTANLTLPNDPTLPTGFSLVGNFPSAIAPGSEATFTVQLDTSAAGTFNGTLSFGNNDSDENPFDFPIEATVANPTTNTPPTLDQLIADRVDEVGDDFSLDLSGNFSDADGDTLTYTATGLPDGLTLDPSSGVISGTLTQAGVSAIAVTANDGNGGTIGDDFNLTVSNPPNDGPGGGGTNPPGDNPGGGTPPNDGPGGGGTPPNDGPGGGTNPPGPSTPFLKEIADKYLQLQGGASQLKFSLKQSNAGKFVHEMGVFPVDDAQGRIGGIAPGEQGYLKAAFAKAKTLFSALPRNQFADMNFARQLGVEAGTRLGFYLVQNGTTDAVQADLAAGRTPNNVLLASAGYADIAELGQNGFTIAWEDATSGAAADFKDLLVDVELTTDAPAIGANLDTELLDLRGQADLLPANFTVNSEAAFNNTFGFYAIDDASGRINGLNPGDAGYAEAALQNRVDTNAGLPGGKILAPFVVANGTAEEFLAENAQNQPGSEPMAYFSFLGANPDKVDHIRMLGDNTFGIEDLYGGGDRDFNDLVVQVEFA